VPAWSPLCLNRLIELDARAPGLVRLADLETALRYFPLNADLHQSVGLRKLRAFGRENPVSWQRDFGLASRLQPSSWEAPMAQARACRRIAPAQALVYWQQAIERGGIHRQELLGTALQETGGSPAAQSAWGHYAEAHPQLLLAYAQLVPETLAPYYYGRWWKLRANAPDLTEEELRDFYLLAPRWGNREDFQAWSRRHAACGIRDYRQWAALLHGWGADDEAWQILSVKSSDPPYPGAPPNVPREVLESTWRTRPENVVNAQQLAQVRQQAGDQAGCDEILVTVANGEKPPLWFVNKAAWALARAGRPGEAVDLLLRPR
jgi:hypothetical protein